MRILTPATMSPLLSRVRQLKALVGYRLFRLKNRFRYHRWNDAEGRSSLPVFGQTPHPGNLLIDFVPGTACRSHTNCWPTAGLAARLAQRHGLVIFNDGDAPAALRPRLLNLPRWVGLSMAITGDLASFRAGLQKRMERDLAVIERSLRTDVCRDLASLEEFYHRHYRPAARERHGEAALVSPLSSFHASLSSGKTEMLRAFEGDAWIATLYASYSSEGYHLQQFGWRDGDITIVQKGALKVLYFAAIARAFELGLNTVKFGGTPPCLLSGIFFQKSRWCAQLAQTGTRYGKVGLLLDPAHPGAREFLKRHALVFPGTDDRFYVISGRFPSEVPSYASQAKQISAWYRLRDHPSAPSDVHSDLPAHLQPWFDALPLTT